MSDKISVIVPIYNGEKYLVRCLDSLKRQTWQNIEFLLIDDGSKDGSAAICQRYAAKDNRFVYRYKENGGVSSARNLGLELATGDYIGFCDCDDWVDDVFYQLLLEAAYEKNAEMVVCGYVEESGDSPKAVSQKGACRLLTQDDALTEMLLGKISGAVWNKLIAAKMAKNSRFSEDIRFGEDALYCTDVLLQAQTIAHANTIVYHYVWNGDSVMHVGFKAYTWDSLTANLRAMEKLACMPENVVNAQRTGLVRTVCFLLEASDKAHVLKKERYQSCKKILRENKSKAVISPLTFGEKCRYYTFKSGRVFLDIYCKASPVLYRVYRSLKR